VIDILPALSWAAMSPTQLALLWASAPAATGGLRKLFGHAASIGEHPGVVD